MVGKPVPVSNAQRPRGSPFSMTAQGRAVSAEPETDSYSVGEELLVDLNPFVQDGPGDCNFVWLPSEVECMNTVGLISQNQVVATDLLQLETCTPLFTNIPPFPYKHYKSLHHYFPISGKTS